MLSIKNLNINQPRIICKELSINLPIDARLAVIGRNGVGKTTLIEQLLTLKNLYINNLPLLEQKDNIKQLIAYYSQNHDFYPYITVKELFNFINYDINYYLKFFDIPNIFLDQLSSGQKQIIYILFSLMQNSKIILLDEPASNLDWINYRQIFDLLLTMQNKYIICATHDIHNLKYFTHILYLKGDGIWEFSKYKDFKLE